MRCYGIKNKDGKYISKFHNYDYRKIKGEQRQPSCTSEICNAMLFKDYEAATLGRYSDMEVVEVTIAEGDLEKDFVSKNYHDVVVENYKIALNDFGNEQTVNENLLQQLAEKDKEIINIRHEICEKIRKQFDNEYYWCYGDNYNNIVIAQEDFNIILDQIEKGEEE